MHIARPTSVQSAEETAQGIELTASNYFLGERIELAVSLRSVLYEQINFDSYELRFFFCATMLSVETAAIVENAQWTAAKQENMLQKKKENFTKRVEGV